MLKLCFINPTKYNLESKLGSIINSDIKRKYKICSVDIFTDLSSFIEAQLNNIDTDIHSKLLVFSFDGVDIPEDIKYVYLFHKLCLSNLDEYSSDIKKDNYTNLQKQISKGLKKINFIASCFEDKQLSTILMMPRRNFTSVILGDIFNCLKESYLNTNNKDLNAVQKLFYDFIEKHRKPKVRAKNKSIKYFRDNNDFFFQLGNEKHGMSETNDKNHNANCTLSGYFRFGIRLDRNIHFNVSSDQNDSIPKNSEFFDCHSEKHIVRGNISHLNIFTNDYIR